MKKAWIEDGVIRDVCPGDPVAHYHPAIAALYTAEVPDDAANGDAWDGATLEKPAAIHQDEPAAPGTPKVSAIAFKMLFTSAERISAKALRATDPVMEDFWGLLDDPRTLEVDLGLASVQAAVEYTLAAVKANGVAELDVAARKAAILSGIVQ